MGRTSGLTGERLAGGESIPGSCVNAGGVVSAEMDDMCAVLSGMGQSVRRFLFGMCGDWHVAEDLAQESLLKAWRSRASFGGRANVRTWVFGIARNAWIDHLRRRSVRERQQAMIEARELQKRPATCDPAASAARDEFSVQMARALTRLPDEQREALAMRESDGLTFAEIARLLEVPVGTVKSRVRYALMKLADELRAFAPEQTS